MISSSRLLIAPTLSPSDKLCPDSWFSVLISLSRAPAVLAEFLDSFSCLTCDSDPTLGLLSPRDVFTSAWSTLDDPPWGFSSADCPVSSVSFPGFTASCTFSDLLTDSSSDFPCSGNDALFINTVCPPAGTKAGIGDCGSSSFFITPNCPSLPPVRDSVLPLTALAPVPDELESDDIKTDPVLNTGTLLSCILLLVSPGPSSGRGGVEERSSFTFGSPFWEWSSCSTWPFTTRMLLFSVQTVFSPCSFTFVTQQSSTVFSLYSVSSTFVVKLLPRGCRQHFKSEWDGFLELKMKISTKLTKSLKTLCKNLSGLYIIEKVTKSAANQNHCRPAVLWKPNWKLL